MGKLTKTLLLAFLGLLIAVGVLGYLLFSAQKKQVGTTNTTPTPTPIAKVNVPAIARSNNTGSVEKKAIFVGEGKAQLLSYTLTGTFDSALQNKNGVLWGEFTIKDDPLKQKINVEFIPLEGQMSFLKYKGTLKAVPDELALSQQDLQSSISAGSQGIIRTLIPYNAPTEENLKELPTLENLVANKWPIPNDFVFSAFVSGIIVQ